MTFEIYREDGGSSMRIIDKERNLELINRGGAYDHGTYTFHPIGSDELISKVNYSFKHRRIKRDEKRIFPDSVETVVELHLYSKPVIRGFSAEESMDIAEEALVCAKVKSCTNAYAEEKIAYIWV